MATRVPDSRAVPAGLFCSHVLLPTLVGALIYVLFRDPGLRVFAWIDSVHLTPLVTAWRSSIEGISLPSLVLYCLPDALWVYATTSWMILIWHSEALSWRNVWLYSGIGLGLGSELGQGVGVIPGTFDLWDVILSAVAFGFSIFLLRGKFNGDTETSRSASGFGSNAAIRSR